MAPSNRSNNAYNFITQTAPKVRDITQSNAQLDAMDLVGGEDYEKLESARLLSSSEYSLNSALGYVSLKSTLQPDQVLAVAFEYTYRGQTYQVGEFSTDIKDNTQALLVKSLKNTANTPKMGNWKLMMRNVYALGATAVQRERFFSRHQVFVRHHWCLTFPIFPFHASKTSVYYRSSAWTI